MSYRDRFWIEREVRRSVYAASGPGVQADVSPAGYQSMEFGHCHKARVRNLPPQYDSISGPTVVEPGVRVTYAMHPQTLDKQPVAVELDSDRFTEEEARAWLSVHRIRDYDFLPDDRDRVPVTKGNPRAEGEKPPKGFSDIEAFYAATIPVDGDGERSASIDAAAVERARDELGYRLALDKACNDIIRHHF
jgi:hypothetical protein